MLQQGISRGAENANDPCFRKKAEPGKTKGLKQRTKALSDVKNTIHSHSSNYVENGKKDDKRSKIDGKKIGFGKSIKTDEFSNSLSSLKDENVKPVADASQPEFECINHFICEKANNFNHSEFLGEYKLTKKELDRFGDRRNFFSIDPYPFKINSLSPVEDVELRLSINPTHFDEDIIEDVSVEVPEPSLL